MSENMKKELSNNGDIKQLFLDAIYYAIPRKNNNLKLLLLLTLILEKIRLYYEEYFK